MFLASSFAGVSDSDSGAVSVSVSATAASDLCDNSSSRKPHNQMNPVSQAHVRPRMRCSANGCAQDMSKF